MSGHFKITVRDQTLKGVHEKIDEWVDLGYSRASGLRCVHLDGWSGWEMDMEREVDPITFLDESFTMPEQSKASLIFEEIFFWFIMIFAAIGLFSTAYRIAEFFIQ